MMHQRILRHKIVCFGDSHGLGFDDLANIINFVYLAASIKGLPRRMSSLNIRNNIEAEIGKHVFDYAVLKFGQVDIEFGLWYSTITKGVISKKEYLSDLIDSYDNFLNQLLTIITDDKIIIFGVNLPSIIDSKEAMANCAKIVNGNNINIFNKHEIPDDLIINSKNIRCYKKHFDIKSRTMTHLKFNSMLRDMCIKRGIYYCDNILYSIDKKSGILKQKYCSPKNRDNNRTNHHLNNWHFNNEIKQYLYLQPILDVIDPELSMLTKSTHDSANT